MVISASTSTSRPCRNSFSPGSLMVPPCVRGPAGWRSVGWGSGCRGGAAVWSRRRPAVAASRQLGLVHQREHRLARRAQHRDGEAEPDVVAVVAVLVVDDVATRLPEGLARTQDPRRLAFELEQHLALQHVTEG